MTDAQLEALVAVADAGSFTQAARRLGLTQSAVSHAVTGLEQSLSVALIDRSAQGARLTNAGERVIQHAREILRLKGQIEQDAESARRFLDGQLRIGSFGASASRRLLPPLLEAFSARYPGVGILVREGGDDEVEGWLRDGSVDIAFVNLPIESLETEELAADVLNAVLPSSHPCAGAATIPSTMLANTPFIMSSGGCERMIVDACPDVRFDVRYSIREIETVVAMVARGMGVAIVPRLALPDEAPSGVAFVPLATSHVRHVGIAVRPQESDGTPARALLRMARRRDTETPSRL
ncbi:MAG: LysR family transcriptional regulator [bacterium]